MIYDEKTTKFYRIKRGWFNRLVLEEVIYENIIKCVTEDDFVFDDFEGLIKYQYPLEPATPQPK